MSDQKPFKSWYDMSSGLIVEDPACTVIIEYKREETKSLVISKSFNPLWLLNVGAILLCLVSVILIAWVSIKYGGTLGKIVWVYPAFYLGQIASMFIIDPIHKFWNVKYKSVNNGRSRSPENMGCKSIRR